jgi:hypothetical protein
MSDDPTLRAIRAKAIAVNAFLFSLPYFSSEQYWESYPSWSHGGRGWYPMQQGGTGIMLALMWYQHVHKPGSKEWRPKVIFRAILSEIGD